MNLLASPQGELRWVSGPLPGAVQDLSAARIWGIIRELADAGLIAHEPAGLAAAVSGGLADAAESVCLKQRDGTT